MFWQFKTAYLRDDPDQTVYLVMSQTVEGELLSISIFGERTAAIEFLDSKLANS